MKKIIITFNVSDDMAPVVFTSDNLTHLVGDISGGAFGIEADPADFDDMTRFYLDKIELKISAEALGQHCLAGALSYWQRGGHNYLAKEYILLANLCSQVVQMDDYSIIISQED